MLSRVVYEDFGIGVDRSHPSVQSHIPRVTLTDVKARRVKVQGHEIRETEERPHGPRVALLRKPDSVTAPFFRFIGEE